MRLDLNGLSISLVGCLEVKAEWELSFFLIVSMYELIKMSSAVLFSLWRSGFILVSSSSISALKFFLESAILSCCG